MKLSITVLALSLSCLTLMACSSLPYLSETEKSYQSVGVSTPLTDAVELMSQQLFVTRQYVTEQTPIAVTSFVDLADFSDVGPVGNQLAESFVHHLQANGMRVVEYKAPDHIKVTPTGDFALSRDYTELSAQVPIDYILTGTYSRQNEGLLVNVKLFASRSKIVVATAQGLVPKSVYEQKKAPVRLRDTTGDAVRMVNGQLVRAEQETNFAGFSTMTTQSVESTQKNSEKEEQEESDKPAPILNRWFDQLTED